MSRRARGAVALLFGASIGLTALQAAWSGAASGYAVHGPSQATKHRLALLCDAISGFEAERKALPTDLAELVASQRLRSQDLFDGWQHDIRYERSDHGFTLTSFGRDGRPGGVGIDADLVLDPATRSHPSSLPRLTLGQFLGLDAGRHQAWICAGTGALAGLLCFTLLRRWSWVSIVAGVSTVVATVFVAQVMGVLDIVKYH